VASRAVLRALKETGRGPLPRDSLFTDAVISAPIPLLRYGGKNPATARSSQAVYLVARTYSSAAGTIRAPLQLREHARQGGT
jgi:hypothetical protein